MMLALTLANFFIGALLLSLLVLLQLIQRYLRNPLRKIPAAHPLAHFTSLWMHSVRWRKIENAALKKAHHQLGPIVCLGPHEISVNCVQGGVREVYFGGFEKVSCRNGYNWYAFFANFNGIDNMFSTGRSKPHSTRKRMISNVYSKSFITANPSLLAQMTNILYTRFLPYLSQTFDRDEEPGELNIFALLGATTMDIVTGYLFGLKASSNLLDNPKQLTWWLDLYYSRQSYEFWLQEFPQLAVFVEEWLGYRLTPRWVNDANSQIEQWVLQMCECADANLKSGGGGEPQDTPIVYQQLMNAISKSDLQKDGTPPLTIVVANELLDHLAAGFETSSITLNYIIHELSTHVDIQCRLQQELSALSPRLVPASSPSLPNPKALDTLPLLHAVVWETLRLHSAIPGPQPRFTPPQGCRLGPEEKPYFVPGGIRVSASAGLLHLNEQVYEHATEWRPDRWLDMDKLDQEKRKDMESRWFWAFGSGGRMCIGSHLAVYQIKYIIAALYSNYSTMIVDDAGIEQRDAVWRPW